MRNPDALNLEPPNRISWTWKSVLSARSLHNKGIWKQIGDGSSVKIWEDSWIVGRLNGKPTTTEPNNCALEKVNDLIEEGKWKMELLQQLFIAEEAELTTGIPLSLYRRKYILFWNFSKFGIYTVKSGYAAARLEGECNRRRQSTNEDTSWEIRKHSIWKKLWGLNMKHKLKHFLQKCLQGCLPVKDEIFRRTGKGERVCSSCGEDYETIEHLFFSCTCAKVIWRLSPVR